MSKAMPKELEKAVREVLEEGLRIAGAAYTTGFTRGKLDALKQQAVDHLVDFGGHFGFLAANTGRS